MKLCHNDQWSCPHLWHDLWFHRCHIGVTRVKKVNLAKSLLLLQFTWYCHVTHAYGSPKLSLYRFYTKKVSEVIWVHKVKYKGQILNNVKWENKRCQYVGLSQTRKSLHGDPSIQPIDKKQINRFWWNFVTMTSGCIRICDTTFDLVGAT